MIAARTLDTAKPRQRVVSPSFLCLLTASLALLGLGATVVVLLSSLSPSAEIPNVRTVDLSDIPVGGRRTVYWRGAPVFIAHRTPEEIAQVRWFDNTNIVRSSGKLDRFRVQREEWVVVIPQTMVGSRCRLLGQNPGEERGEMGGWYDPCDGASYDPSGRRWGSPDFDWTNLQIPPYRFIGDTVIEFDDCFPWGC